MKPVSIRVEGVALIGEELKAERITHKIKDLDHVRIDLSMELLREWKKRSIK